jgi:hypothetical protein
MRTEKTLSTSQGLRGISRGGDPWLVRCYDHSDPQEAELLHRSDSSPDGGAPIDLPLREEVPATWEATPPQRYLFESTASVDAERETPRRPRVGFSMWLVAAAALVAGILIGFASGFSAGRRADEILSLWPQQRAADAPASVETRDQTPEQTFTEGTISEPVRVDPAPVVTAPAPPAETEPAVASAPRARPPAAAEPASTGPGSLQIVSRPSGAEVFLDGRVVGRTPLVISQVQSGSHDVRLQLTGFRRWATAVQVRPGARARVAASLEQ